MNFILPASARHVPRRAGIALLAAACTFVPVAAQQPAPASRTEVQAIPLDVVVVDRDGRPVPGLGPAHFAVTVDGQPRKVLTAEFVSSAPSGDARPAVGPARWDIDEAFDSAYAVNEQVRAREAAPARTIMIAIDQGSFSPAAGRTAANAARSLLDSLNPEDRVGLAAFPPPGPSVRPTRDHERVRAALSQVTGSAEEFPRTEISLTAAEALAWTSGDSVGRDQILERACSMQTRSSRMGISDMCRQAVEGAANQVLHYARRQALLSLLGLGDAIRSASRDGGPSAVVVVSTGLYGGAMAARLDLDDEVRAVGKLAAVSRASLYPVHVQSGFLERDSMDRRNLTGFSIGDEDLRLEGLRHLAGVAGGAVTRVASATDAAFKRTALELSASYALGIEALPSDRDGQRHRVRVRVEQPNLTVRAREEIYLPVTRKLTGDDALREALVAPQLERALPLRLATQTVREPGSDKVRLVISAQVDRAVKQPGSIRLGFLVRGTGNAGTAGLSDLQNRKLPVVGTGDEASLAYVETAVLNPGRYLLRLAAVDEGNRVGTVEKLVDVALAGGAECRLSDLLLVDPPRALKEGFAPVADGRMTGDSVEAFLELYPQKDQAVGSVVFDISDTPGGAAIASGSVVPEKKEGRLSAGLRFELRALPPGTYMLNARALDGERVLGRVSRPFRIDRAAAIAAGPRAAFAFAGTGGVVRTFARQDALRPDALDFFLGRLREAEGAGTDRPAVGTAAQAMRNARFDAALDALSSEAPDVLAVTFLKGLALFGQGKLEPAAAEFRGALRLSNEFLPAAFYLGACYAAGGRDREAVGAWQTSLVSESDSRIVYEVLADAWLRLKDGRRAEAIIAEAQGRWPDDEVFRPRLAAAKALQNRRNEAFATLEPYVVQHPTEAEPLFLAIRLLYEAHDSGKPIKSAAEDRALAQKYGELYGAAGGTEQPLVNRWVGAMK